MAENNGVIKRFLQLSNDDPRKTLVIAVVLCLVCSVLVSTAAVTLKPVQQANQQNDMRANILAVVGLADGAGTVEEKFSQFEIKLVDLDAGHYADDNIDPITYDQAAAAADPAMSRALSGDEDIASIKRRANLAPVYLLQKDGKIEQVVIPVHGYGLWSTMYGFISLEGDFNTIRGLRFYQHGETPGLGGEIDNPKWRAQWEGKKAFDDAGNLKIRVVRGHVDASTPEAEFKVDGLSGATLTSNGVTNLVQFWLGDKGFDPYLKNMRSELGK